MRIRYCIPLSLLLVTLLLFQASQGSYISDGSIVLLRSQFVTESQNPITLDGSLDEEIWQKADEFFHSIPIPESLDMTIYVLNTLDYLYLGLDITDFAENENDSLLITFDTDGNGELTAPEDGRYISDSTAQDYYWDGSTWRADGFSPSLGSSDFGQDRDNGRQYYEFRIPLVANDVEYDGLRVVDPSNSYISFNIQYRDTITGPQNVVYNFPSEPDNATGYFDLKIAGPEDQDLPDFNPPTDRTDDIDDTGEEFLDEGEAGQLSLAFTMFLGIGLLVLIRMRRDR